MLWLSIEFLLDLAAIYWPHFSCSFLHQLLHRYLFQFFCKLLFKTCFQSEWGLAQLLKMSVATLGNLSSMGPWNSHSRRKSIPIPPTPTDVNARIRAWGCLPPASHNKVILCSFKYFNQITYCIRFQIFMEVFNFLEVK